MKRTRAEVEITADNLWFSERYLNVFEFASIFPPDVFAGENERGNPIVLVTDLGFSIETDIEKSKMQIRNRSKLHGWTRFTSEHQIQPGDRIVVERIGDREYSLRLDRPKSP